MSSFFTNQEWVKAAQAGEKAAWSILYRQHYPALYAVALRICQDIDTAKDALQDAFMIAYLKLNQLKNAEAFEGWLKKIVMHTCYRKLRQNRVYERLPVLPFHTDGRWEDELNNKFDSFAAQSKLYAAIASLPEVLRSTLMLRYFSSFQSYEEIAAILSVPVGTVRSRLNQVKVKLAEQWNHHLDVPPTILNQSEEWNHFYYTNFSAMHKHDDSKNQIIDHLHKNVQVISPDNKAASGKSIFEGKIIADREAGSWLTPVNVVSSGHITIIELIHFNSPEHSDHCKSALICGIKEDAAFICERVYNHAQQLSASSADNSTHLRVLQELPSYLL